MSHEMTPQEVQKHIRVYLTVFALLAVLTVVTVAVGYVHLAIVPAVIVALLVATVKGSLVGAYFMHLIDERKVIYATLALVAFFFIMLMLIPLMAHAGNVVVENGS
jgi:cytochrome c oxidase subunit 4